MARKRPPFDTHTDILIETGSKKSGGHRKVTLGGEPKRLTKGLRRELVKKHRENPSEFQRQCAILGISNPNDVLNKRSSKK